MPKGIALDPQSRNQQIRGLDPILMLEGWIVPPDAWKFPNVLNRELSRGLALRRAGSGRAVLVVIRQLLHLPDVVQDLLDDLLDPQSEGGSPRGIIVIVVIIIITVILLLMIVIIIIIVVVVVVIIIISLIMVIMILSPRGGLRRGLPPYGQSPYWYCTKILDFRGLYSSIS